MRSAGRARTRNKLNFFQAQIKKIYQFLMHRNGDVAGAAGSQAPTERSAFFGAFFCAFFFILGRCTALFTESTPRSHTRSKT